MYGIIKALLLNKKQIYSCQMNPACRRNYEHFNKGTEAAIKIVDTKFEFEIDFYWWFFKWKKNTFINIKVHWKLRVHLFIVWNRNKNENKTWILSFDKTLRGTRSNDFFEMNIQKVSNNWKEYWSSTKTFPIPFVCRFQKFKSLKRVFSYQFTSEYLKWVQ